MIVIMVKVIMTGDADDNGVVSRFFLIYPKRVKVKQSDDEEYNSGDEGDDDEVQLALPTLCRMLAKALVALHLKVSWRSCPAGPGFWKRTHAMPLHSPTRTGWTSRAMLGDVWGGGGGHRESHSDRGALTQKKWRSFFIGRLPCFLSGIALDK